MKLSETEAKSLESALRQLGIEAEAYEFSPDDGWCVELGDETIQVKIFDASWKGHREPEVYKGRRPSGVPWATG